MGNVGDLFYGAAGRIGRYFSVLSVVPSALLVAYIYALATAGAWSGSPDWGAAATSLGDLKFAAIVGLSLASLLVGLMLHPLQYALTQFLEGYWGLNRIAVKAMGWGARKHRKGREYVNDVDAWASAALFPIYEKARNTDTEAFVDGEHLPHLLARHEAIRLRARYPEDTNDIRPTRLGNVLRRYELRAGAQYGIDAVTVFPRLAQVARAEDVAYVDDQRTELDLAVRMVAISTLATCASVIFLWRSGLWLLLTLVPYALIYVSYRGAVAAAGAYGVAFTVLIDLNRFTLYDQLGLARPMSLRAERDRNEMVMDLLRSEGSATNVTYTSTPTRGSPPG